jgi:hypothetical protein
MINKDNWEETERRFMEYWAMENHDRPLMTVRAPKAGYVKKEIKVPKDLMDRWLDTRYIIENSKENFRATFFGGESFPMINPNLGPDFIAATLGCDLTFAEDTSWSHPIGNLWDRDPGFVFDPDNIWWKDMMRITMELCKESSGRYLVGMTDFHAGIDAISAMRGPETLCFDLYENPQAVKNAVIKIFEAYKAEFDIQYSLISGMQHGSVNWMNIWYPGKWYVTSCDFIGMISPEMFDEFVLPELNAELDFFDASMFHLDGPDALKHLDALLDLPKLKGIQWVYGAGQPTASAWIPVLKKIQKAKKMIHIETVPEDMDILLSELEPEGVLYNMNCPSESDAMDILAKADKSRRKKMF